jgi:Mce-associated membrane protein
LAVDADPARKLIGRIRKLQLHRQTSAGLEDKAGNAAERKPEQRHDDQPRGEATNVEPSNGAEGEPDHVAAEPDHTAAEFEHAAARSPYSAVRLAIIVGLVMVVALAGLAGWLGLRAYKSQQAAETRHLFLQVARQGALNLTTISYIEADDDIHRILDSSTGSFYDDFQKRSQPFIDVVKKAQAKSEGTVTEAGMESEEGDQARVLVAVTVKTSNAGAEDQQPRLWRMRITVQKVNDGAKVSDVEFVP